VKRRDLVQKIEQMGCVLIRHGGHARHRPISSGATRVMSLDCRSPWLIILDGYEEIP